MVLLVVNILPVLLKGKTSKNKLIEEAKRKKLPILFSLKNFNFLIIKIKNEAAIINISTKPTTPVSVKISK